MWAGLEKTLKSPQQADKTLCRPQIINCPILSPFCCPLLRLGQQQVITLHTGTVNGKKLKTSPQTIHGVA